MILLVNLAMHFYARPFVVDELDIEKSCSLINLTFTVISGIVFYTKAVDTVHNPVHGINTYSWTIVYFISIFIQMFVALNTCAWHIISLHNNSRAVRLIL